MTAGGCLDCLRYAASRPVESRSPAGLAVTIPEGFCGMLPPDAEGMLRVRPEIATVEIRIMP